MNKDASELLYMQKVKDEIYPVNPDGESLAKLEMIAEIKSIDPSITCFTDIELGPKIKNDKWVQKWDILINSTGVGSLGRVGIVYFDLDYVAIDSHITVVRAKKPLFFHYLGRNLLYRQLEIENMAVGSTGQTELPRERVKSLTILLPDDDTLEKFNDLIESIAIKMYHGLEESRRLAELRDALLPRLMSGDLKVDDVKL